MDHPSGTTTPMGEAETIQTFMRKETSKSLPPKLSDARQWPLWKVKMKVHLQSAGVWDIVTAERVVPAANATEEDRRAYRKDKSKAHNDLLRCLGPQYEKLAVTFDTAREIWECLNDLCEQPPGTELLRVQTEIEGLTSSTPLSNCLLNLKRLLRELEALGGVMSLNQKTVKLLKILPQRYSELILAIQTTDLYKIHTLQGNPAVLTPTNDYDFSKIYTAAYKRALVEEAAKPKQQQRSETVFYTATGNFQRRKQKPFPRNPQGKLVCELCKERGHLEKNCTLCPVCLQHGHSASQCFQLPKLREILQSKQHLDQQTKPLSTSKTSKPSASSTEHINLLGTSNNDNRRQERCCMVTLSEPPGFNGQPMKSFLGEPIKSRSGTQEPIKSQISIEPQTPTLSNPPISCPERAQPIKHTPNPTCSLIKSTRTVHNKLDRYTDRATLENQETSGENRNFITHGAIRSTHGAGRRINRSIAGDFPWRTSRTSRDSGSDSAGPANSTSTSRSQSSHPVSATSYTPFIIDSASQVHLCTKRELLTDLTPLLAPLQLRTAAGSFTVSYKGTINAISRAGIRVSIKDVYFQPDGIDVLSFYSLRKTIGLVLGREYALFEDRSRWEVCKFKQGVLSWSLTANTSSNSLNGTRIHTHVPTAVPANHQHFCCSTLLDNRNSYIYRPNRAAQETSLPSKLQLIHQLWRLSANQLMNLPVQIKSKGSIHTLESSFNSNAFATILPVKYMDAAREVKPVIKGAISPLTATNCGFIDVLIRKDLFKRIHAVFVDDPSLQDKGIQFGFQFMMQFNILPYFKLQEQAAQGHYAPDMVKRGNLLDNSDMFEEEKGVSEEKGASDSPDDTSTDQPRTLPSGKKLEPLAADSDADIRSLVSEIEKEFGPDKSSMEDEPDVWPISSLPSMPKYF